MKPIYLIPLLTLSACATLTAESEQQIAVATSPSGAACELHNAVGGWGIAETPGMVEVERSYSPLSITCIKGQYSGSQVIEPQTRGRAYGNILLLGVPALVDAQTGKGYEYEPASISIELK